LESFKPEGIQTAAALKGAPEPKGRPGFLRPEIGQRAGFGLRPASPAAFGWILPCRPGNKRPSRPFTRKKLKADLYPALRGSKRSRSSSWKAENTPILPLTQLFKPPEFNCRLFPSRKTTALIEVFGQTFFDKLRESRPELRPGPGGLPRSHLNRPGISISWLCGLDFQGLSGQLGRRLVKIFPALAAVKLTPLSGSLSETGRPLPAESPVKSAGRLSGA
jgi:hypothetical protein